MEVRQVPHLIDDVQLDTDAAPEAAFPVGWWCHADANSGNVRGYCSGVLPNGDLAIRLLSCPITGKPELYANSIAYTAKELSGSTWFPTLDAMLGRSVGAEVLAGMEVNYGGLRKVFRQLIEAGDVDEAEKLWLETIRTTVDAVVRNLRDQEFIEREQSASEGAVEGSSVEENPWQ